MPNETDKINEQITEHLKRNVSFQDISLELSIPIEQVESVCFHLCKSVPSEFKYAKYMTKEWLEEKLKDHTIFGIANITHLSYRQVQYHLGKHGLTNRRMDSEQLPTEEELRRLFLTEKLGDKKIAERYEVPIYTIKNLRYKYGIMRSERVPVDQILTLPIFRRLHIELGISMSQLAVLFGVNRSDIAQLKNDFCASDASLAAVLASHHPSRKNQKLFERMLDEIPHSELIEELKTKDLYEVAFQHNLIKGSDRNTVPFSREWFLLELQTKSPTKIANETGKSYAAISQMLDEHGIERSKRKDEINPSILRRLFLELYWSDTDIGNQFGISPFAVRRQREAEGIYIKDRMPLEQRLPVELFSKLYLVEGLSLFQIGKAFRTSPANLRALKQQYIAEGHSEFDKIRVPGVSEERFTYLQNQIVLGVYKI